MSQRLAAIILAAGRGTRMRSERAKVLHPLLGRPMITWAIRAAIDADADLVSVVVGHQADEVRATALDDARPGDRDALAFATQPTQRGTGDAVRCGLPSVAGAQTVLVMCGDTPGLDADTLRALVVAHRDATAAVTVATFTPDAPGRYGRIIRDRAGDLASIVEFADATEEEAAIPEVNAGLYAFDAAFLADALARLTTDNAQGELYLTDAVALARADGRDAATLHLVDPIPITGVNTRAELAELEQRLLARRRDALMREGGVTIEAPDTVWLDADVTVGPDTRLGPRVALRGRTSVGAGCDIGAGCVLTDCQLADAVTLLPYVVADEARLDTGSRAGPFSHLRPGTALGPRSRVGNFVETKKARLGEGSKANHLSYLGDCEIGRAVNVGAGTITCNYDGVDKHRTVIEDGAFIGSDTQLVAPVRVGRHATIGAGTTVTRDVPEGALALSRCAQRDVEGYYERRRKPREDARRASPTSKDPKRG